jgi:peptidoglycan hydrolase-like protein with peptidoglycan-binding domain
VSTSPERPHIRLATSPGDRDPNEGEVVASPPDATAMGALDCRSIDIADPTDGRFDATPGRRRRWGWLAAAMALAATAGVGWVAGRNVRSPDQAASEAAAPIASWITAPVDFRVLAQTVISRGDVRAEVSTPVGVPSSIEGDPVITGIDVSAGDEVIEGQRVVEVSGRPVFVMTGAVPVYRTLRPGMTGEDVTQLQQALARRGCASIDEAGVYGDSTKACVAQFYNDSGYDAVPTSQTEAADIATASKAVSDADALLAVAQATFDRAATGAAKSAVLAAQQALAAAQRGYDDAIASSASGVTTARADLTAAQTQLDQVRADPAATAADIAAAQATVDTATASVDAAHRTGASAVAAAADQVALAQVSLNETTAAPDRSAEYLALGQAIQTRDQATTALAQLQAVTGATVPQGEIVFTATMPARVRNAVTALGAPSDGNDPVGGSSPSTALVDLAGGALVVDMTLRADERELVAVGTPVELLDEQANITYPAAITAVADTASTAGDGGLGYLVTITPDDVLPDSVNGANLRVTITAASTDTPTLVVPLAAVSSGADGSTFVSIVANTDSGVDTDPSLVPVKAGLAADGFVAIEPVDVDSLTEGDRVVVGR